MFRTVVIGLCPSTTIIMLGTYVNHDTNVIAFVTIDALCNYSIEVTHELVSLPSIDGLSKETAQSFLEGLDVVHEDEHRRVQANAKFYSLVKSNLDITATRADVCEVANYVESCTGHYVGSFAVDLAHSNLTSPFEIVSF